MRGHGGDDLGDECDICRCGDLAARHGAQNSVHLRAVLRLEQGQKVITSVILGLKRIDQLEENLKAVEVALSEDDLAALDEASALTPEYPGWMMASGEGPRAAAN